MLMASGATSLSGFPEVGNLVDVIAANAMSVGGAPALVDRERIISYAELAQLIGRHAGLLQELGVQPKQRVALVLQDHADHLILLLAVASLGAAALSMNWRGKLEEKQAIAEAFAVDFVIHEPETRPPRGFRAMPLDDEWHRRAGLATPLAPIASARQLPFRILLTSGTTGIPKGVELTHAGALGWCEMVRRVLDLRSGHRHLSTIPLAFSGSVAFNLPHILLGNTVELFPTFFTAEEFVEAVVTRGVTGSILVPTVLRQLFGLARDRRPLLPQLDYLVSLGAPLRPDERRTASELLTPRFYDNYGASGGGPITFLRPEDIAEHAESVGRANPLREVEIVDELDAPLPAGREGRLRCRGPGVAERFCNDGNSETETFREGWYYPGELAKMDDQGFIYLTGRASELIQRGGLKLHPAEVEDVLAGHPNVSEAAVVGAPAPDNEEDVIAFVRLSGPTPERELVELCRRNLASYKVPKSIIPVPDLPRTPIGKVNKPELIRMFQSKSRSEQA
jgi:acyl-coenzyme A synthetase/AMP-(fatty) acid ligase